MWNKIYLAILAAAVLVMCFFTFYAGNWLTSIGDPRDAIAGYEYYAGLGMTFLSISTVILLVLANVILWKTRRGWAMWTTLGYFAIFLSLRIFWLEKTRYTLQYPESLFFTPALIGGIGIIAAGSVVFINQLLNLRLNGKLNPPPETIENDEVLENEV